MRRGFRSLDLGARATLGQELLCDLRLSLVRRGGDRSVKKEGDDTSENRHRTLISDEWEFEICP